MDNDLFIEPPWIQRVTAALSKLRAEVVAQGLRWERPTVGWSGMSWYASWRSNDGHVLRWFQTGIHAVYMDHSLGVTEGDIIDLYRKWIERHEAKP